MKHSVLVITYNSEKTINKTLDSLVKQTILPSEILVCDDASTDNTLDNLNKYMSLYPDLIKIHVNSENLGIGENIINGVRKLKFPIISLVAGDDWVSEDAIEVLNETIDKQGIKPDVDLFACVPELIKVKPCGAQIKTEHSQIHDSFITKIITRNLSFLKMGISKNLILQSTYPDEIGPWADFSWDMSIANKVQKVITIEKPLYFYREGTGLSSKSSYRTLAVSFFKSVKFVHANYSNSFTTNEQRLLEMELLIAKLQVRKYKSSYLSIILRHLEIFGLKITIRQILRIVKAAIAGWYRFE